MACTPTRLELSNTDATTVNVTVSADPGDGTAVVLEVPGLSINESQNTSGGSVSYSIAARTEGTNSLWDGTLQVGTNNPADIVVQIVETSAAQTVGVTISDAAVSYCAPTAGATSYSNLTSGTVQIDLLPASDDTLDLGSADYRWAEIHGDLDGPVMFRAKASSGTLAVGDVVYIDGVSGETPTVAKAAAGSASTMPAFGIISTGGTAPAEVYVTTLGSLNGVALPSATYSVGDILYVSTTAGQFTKTAPTGESNLLQNIGKVVRTSDTNGIIKVGGAGRSNATPNLNSGNIFYGNGSNQATAVALTSVAAAASHTHPTSDIVSGTFADARIDLRVDAGATFDGQGAAVATAESVLVPIERAGVITAASLIADASGSITITVKRYTPSAGSLGSATTLGTIALASAQHNRDTTLSGWTTSVSAGDVLEFLTGGTIATVERVTVKVKVEES